MFTFSYIYIYTEQEPETTKRAQRYLFDPSFAFFRSFFRHWLPPGAAQLLGKVTLVHIQCIVFLAC